jgi:hypothetical protein
MRKLFKISAIIAALLILIVGGVLFNRLSQFRAEIARLKSEGSPVSFEDLKTAPEEIAIDGTDTFNRLQSSLASFEAEMWEDEEVATRPVDDGMIARFDELNQAYPDVFPLLDELAQADDLCYEFQGDFQPAINAELDRVQKLRSCARVLAWKMRVLAAQQKLDEAAAAGVQIFELCRVFDQQPTLVAHLVRVACEGIAISYIHKLITTHDISEEARKRLNQSIESRATSDHYLESLITERAAGIEYISQMGLFQMAFNGNAYLEAINEEIENCQKQPFEQEFESEDRYTILDGWVAGSILPALRQLRMASARTTSQLRALRIINALLAHPEAAGKEITPEYLIEIGVPEAMTIDTMTGEPMIVKRIDDHWVVYSVGWNLKDDGGDPNPSPSTGDFSLGVDEE